MIFSFEERPSDSPFVETIWRAQSERAGAFSSLAASHWEIVVTKHNGKMTLTVRGPETKATPMYCSVQAEWFGIIFKFGTFLQEGVSILDTVALAGYADQPHLTRSLKYLIGKTPAQIVRKTDPEQMSLLFKTEPLF